MGHDITYYCRKYNCGECCERGWNIFVTENDIKNWETSRPEILDEVISEVIDNKIRKLLKKRTVEFPDGKIRNICIFYDFNAKCLIHDFNPEICRNFSCTKHLFFIFRLFNSLSHLIDALSPNSTS